MVEGNMNTIGSRSGLAMIAAVFITLPTQATFAQQVSTTVRTVLGVTSLLSAVDAPLFFKLSKIELVPGQTTNYFGPVGFLYVLSGSLAVQADAEHRSLRQD